MKTKLSLIIAVLAIGFAPFAYCQQTSSVVAAEPVRNALPGSIAPKKVMPDYLRNTDLFIKRVFVADYENEYTQTFTTYSPVFYNSAFLILNDKDKQEFIALNREYSALMMEYQSFVARFGDFYSRYKALHERGRPTATEQSFSSVVQGDNAVGWAGVGADSVTITKVSSKNAPGKAQGGNKEINVTPTK